MQNENELFDFNFLQKKYENVCSLFEEALKKDVEFAELKNIFQEMISLYTRITEMGKLRRIRPLYTGEINP